MPTVVLLDVSLSMSKYVKSNEEPVRIIDLAAKNIVNFFDHLASQCKLEFTSLVVFSSLYEVLVKFTRDFDVLKNACESLTTYDKTVFESAFQCVEQLVIEEWGVCVPINLILITDGLCGIGEGSLKETLSNVSSRKHDNKFPIPFAFPCHLSIICLSAADELKRSKKHFEQLITLNGGQGELLVPDSLNNSSVMQCFSRLMNTHYMKYKASLVCGNFQSAIALSPSPNFQNSLSSVLNHYEDAEELTDFSKLKLGPTLEIIGFLDLQDFSNPPFLSRHIVLPISDGVDKQKEQIGFQPSFCVLLHGSLKMERMGAVVKLREDWFAMLFSCADSKKKSTLMLTIFPPKLPFTWLGDMTRLGPAYELTPHPYQYDVKDNAEDTPFPVAPPSRRSYHAQSNAVWIKSSGLQSDVQKLLRYARKLPDKQSAFFKEVNKLRRAGVMYGFHELLNELASVLENEGSKMPAEANVQLRHVSEGLRNAPLREVNKNIIAISMFRKKFSE